MADRGFSTAGPKLWNSLPRELQTAPCLVLRNSLKLTSLKLVITYNSSCYSYFTALQVSNFDLSIF